MFSFSSFQISGSVPRFDETLAQIKPQNLNESKVTAFPSELLNSSDTMNSEKAQSQQVVTPISPQSKPSTSETQLPIMKN